MGILLRSLFFVWMLVTLLSLGPRSSLGRSHFHKKQKSSPKKDRGHSSVSPVDSPADPPITTTDPSNSSSGPCIFDVRSYGAVGDGSTDDTEAFREAWKAACSVESSTLLVPSDGVFMITSTIFSGPCQPGLVFQVILSRTKSSLF